VVSTTATEDVALLAVVVGLIAIGLLVLQIVRSLQPARPMLPAEDRAPAGLGRLVPAGAGQVEQEARRGVVTLELWLTAHRRRSAAAVADGPAGTGLRDARPARGTTAREVG
jgi:hypothetical protein